MDEGLYAEWLLFVFDRPETSREWYWDSSITDFKATDEDKVRLIGQTFLRSGADLGKYSEIQVRHGLNFILNNTVSNAVFLLTQKGVSEDIRIEAVMNMKHLYRDCFAKRCQPVLGHLNEGGGPLNMLCYMLWDFSPLGRWNDVVVEVMEDALYLPHDACIESGLHGLGHRKSQDNKRSAEIIDRFLAKTKSLRTELRQYAVNAKTGNIQ